MRWSLLRFLLMFFVFTCLATTPVSSVAVACDRCRALGTTAFHIPDIPAVGGDDEIDAMFPPSDDNHGVAEYVLAGGRWPQPNGPGSPVTLTYSFQNMFDGGLKMPDGQPLPNGLIRKSIEEALGLWASVAPLTFREVEDDGLSYAQGSAKYGQLRFRHVFINGPDPPPPAQPIAKAQAYYPVTGNALAGDVEFDHGDRWQEVGTLSQPDILGAAIHEIGHTLGLGHSNLPSANMYWIFTRYGGLTQGALTADDIAGVRSIYGVGRGRVISLVPEPANSTLLLIVGLWGLTRRARRRPL